MKKHPIGFLMLTAITLVSITATKAGGWQWQAPTKITGYVIEGAPVGDHLYIRFEPSLDTLNPDACTGANVEWKRIYGDTGKGKQMFASVLSVKAASQTVIVSLIGCDDWGRPIIDAVYVQ